MSVGAANATLSVPRPGVIVPRVGAPGMSASTVPLGMASVRWVAPPPRTTILPERSEPTASVEARRTKTSVPISDWLPRLSGKVAVPVAEEKSRLSATS